MPRKNRLFLQGMPQLIQIVGHNHDTVFMDEDDYQMFLTCLDQALALYHCPLHAYTLLRNELYLLITPATKTDLSRLIQHIGRSYVHYYNQKYHRTGTLWESRYRSCLVEPGTYVLLTQQFVESCAKVAYHEQQWRWSSYLHSTGERFQERLTPHQEYLALGKTPDERAIKYRQFLQTPFGTKFVEQITACLHQNCVLGTPQFCQKVEGIIQRPVRPRKIGRPRKYFDNQIADWVWVEQHISTRLQHYCYQEIRLPLLDETGQLRAFFDIESQQENPPPTASLLALRDEGTLGVLRAIKDHPALQTESKLWYLGTMFRGSESTEMPEEYHQIGVEAIGFSSIDIELEHFMLQYDVLKSLKLAPHVTLQINTAGNWVEFNQFRQALRTYYQPFIPFFEQAQWRDWYDKTPEKLLTIDNPFFNTLKDKAPLLVSYLSAESLHRFEHVVESLKRLGIPYSWVTNLYPEHRYCHTFYAWHCTLAGEDAVICRGGRYDDSASDILHKTTYASGFAFMLEPLIALIKQAHVYTLTHRSVFLTIMPKHKDDNATAFQIGQTLRKAFPRLSMINDYANMKLATRFENAKKRGCRYILEVCEDEGEDLILYDLEKNKETRSQLNQMIKIIGKDLFL